MLYHSFFMSSEKKWGFLQIMLYVLFIYKISFCSSKYFSYLTGTDISRLLSTAEKQRIILDQIMKLQAMEKKKLVGYSNIQLYPGQSISKLIYFLHTHTVQIILSTFQSPLPYFPSLQKEIFLSVKIIYLKLWLYYIC